MNRQLLRRWIFALVAAQIFVSAPMASAFAAMASAGGDDHCAQMLHASEGEASGGDVCPCCPGGESGIAACLSACTASLGAVDVSSFDPPPRAAPRVVHAPRIQHARASDPPLKPPPIY